MIDLIPLSGIAIQSLLALYFQVLTGPLLESVYDNKWYNDEMQGKEEAYYVGYDSLRLGLVRMRQLRMPNESCTIPSDFQSQIKTCYGPYTIGSEDTSPYGPENSTA